MVNDVEYQAFGYTVDQVFCFLRTHHLGRFSLVCFELFSFFFIFQSTRARACWAWYQV